MDSYHATQIKIFYGKDIEELIEDTNIFIQNKHVIDVKLQIGLNDEMGIGKYILVLYQEQKAYTLWEETKEDEERKKAIDFFSEWSKEIGEFIKNKEDQDD